MLGNDKGVDEDIAGYAEKRRRMEKETWSQEWHEATSDEQPSGACIWIDVRCTS